MAVAQPPAMRIKNRWFGDGAPKSAGEQASAMAFIAWRVAHNMLKRMRGADFAIDAGRPYFDFMREVLVFLIALADRIAHERLDDSGRTEFTVTLVRHVARTLQDNEDDLLGAPAAGSPSHGDTFIDLVNELNGHYAEFGADPAPPPGVTVFHPDFGFVRYLGTRLAPTLPEGERRWVLDQVMAIEAPEAVAIVQRSMAELFDPSPRPKRRGGQTGD
jgi:hypothetical protein